MHITARVDYALRAMVELAAGEPSLVKGERIATAQSIPLKLLENILLDLKHGGLVRSRRREFRWVVPNHRFIFFFRRAG